MRISTLEIKNFRAIRNLALRDLGDVVLIAGPNGCGKSCVFDAVRLLKSVYGGYTQEDEWHNFLNEFQLNVGDVDQLGRLFTDSEVEITIGANFLLSEQERDYIKANVRIVTYHQLWKRHVGKRGPGQQADSIQNMAWVGEESEDVAAKVSEGIDNPVQHAHLRIRTDHTLEIFDNPVLQFVFGVFDPKQIGIIDYHGPNRTYQRERVGGINVSIADTADRMAQHALYNSQSKYSNIKSELAGAYVRDLFIKEAGGKTEANPSIAATLKELFSTFLPGKTFLGPDQGLMEFSRSP